MAYSVYTLTDPRDQKVRYVGISEKPYKRYGNHLSLASNTTPKNSWIAELMDNDMLPELTIIERNLDRPTALDREDYWIKFYTQSHGTLFNLAERGKSFTDHEPLHPAQVRIRDIRKAKMLSQKDLAEKAEVNVRMISSIEYGGLIPHMHYIKKIAEALDVEVSEIYPQAQA